jgi:hypothetical protein
MITRSREGVHGSPRSMPSASPQGGVAFSPQSVPQACPVPWVQLLFEVPDELMTGAVVSIG